MSTSRVVLATGIVAALACITWEMATAHEGLEAARERSLAPRSPAPEPEVHTVHGSEIEQFPNPEPLVGLRDEMVFVPGGEQVLGITADEVMELLQSRTPLGLLDERRTASLLGRSLGRSPVLVEGFLASPTELTSEQFAAFLRAAPGIARFPFEWWKPADRERRRREFLARPQNRGATWNPMHHWMHAFAELEWEVPSGQERWPVTWIRHVDALKFCAWAGVRLPTGAEWERAYVGDEKRSWPFGDEWDEGWLETLGLRRSPGDSDVRRPVASIPANRSVHGLFDMAGHVWEATISPFVSYPAAAEEVSKLEDRINALTSGAWRFQDSWERYEADSRIAVRGGSNLVGYEAPVGFHRAIRLPSDAETCASALGFRFVKSRRPGFDTLVLRSYLGSWKRRFGLRGLDLPVLQGAGVLRDHEYRTAGRSQVGLETWGVREGVIREHRCISAVATSKLALFDGLRSWIEGSTSHPDVGRLGTAIAVLHSTEPFLVVGPAGELQRLAAGDYAVEFRGPAPLPAEPERIAGLHAWRPALLFRHAERGYVAVARFTQGLDEDLIYPVWQEPGFSFDATTGRLRFLLGPLLPDRRHRLRFEITIEIDRAQLLSGRWTLPRLR